MIKKHSYTLIELLAAMGIFIMMIGILFKTFSASAEVATRETTKVSILTDSSVFFKYVTDDLRSMIVDVYPAIEIEAPSGSKKFNPDNTGQGTTDHGDSELTFTPTSISFFSNVTPYQEAALTGALGSAPPYVKYEFSGSQITRSMSSDDAGLNEQSGIILEGVEAFSIDLWEDYPGGTQITDSPSPTKPGCITISVTLTTPNPFASQELKDNEKRTITKAIFIKR